MYKLLLKLSVITVGFERINTTVDENIGSFLLCVRIFTGPDLLPAHTNFSFSLNLISIPNSAGRYH